MSDDKNNKAWGLLGNPLPIVMVVLLAAGVLVKNVPLESARPTDPERVNFVATSRQDVEARLWQDPFAAVEKYEKNFNPAVTPSEKFLMMLLAPHVPKAPHERNKDEQCSAPDVSSAEKTPPALHNSEELCENIKEHLNDGKVVTVVAVSVFGGSYAEEAEIRRRTRFAVVSALGFHGYHPEPADAIGYFNITLAEPDAVKLTVPYEWFEKRDRDKSSNVLVLWLNEDKLSTRKPFQELQALFAKLTPKELASRGNGLTVKLIGPAGSGMLRDLVRENKNVATKSGSTIIEMFSPNATISNCDLSVSAGKLDSLPPWNCFKDSPQLKGLTTLPIIRTTGTDDVLTAALLWELWQRGVNREPWWKSWWELLRATFVKRPSETNFPRICEDGMVLIGERDTVYGRTLSRYLTDGFSERCEAKPEGNLDTSHTDKPLAHEPPVRTFTYLRGLDGVLPDIDKSGSKAPPKGDSSKSKDLLAQLEDAPPEHAEGRSQFDYLRRLADEIERLDHKKQFAINGVKAIGIVGSDLYDKLIILQALRSRFKDKIFFTTDLDARYLHTDQKDWARNLVVASNFGLSLRPALQQSTLPFRDSYQTATYLATLMALQPPPIFYLPYWSFCRENVLGQFLRQSILPFRDCYHPALYLATPIALKSQQFNWAGNWAGNWTDKGMMEWLRPQLFEIGRTEAVHLASPSVTDLTGWLYGTNPEGIARQAADTKCDDHWTGCTNIEPDWPSRGLSREHQWEILIMLCLGILLAALTSRYVNETVRAAFDAPSPKRDIARTILCKVIGASVVVFIILAVVWRRMDDSLAQGTGEPFVWLEGVSVWPSLVLRFVGLVTMLALWYMSLKRIQQHKKLISKDFRIAPTKIRTLTRRWWSAAWTGPHLNLASFDEEGKAKANPQVKETKIATLWKNYLRATSRRGMTWWIVVSVLLVCLLFLVVFPVLGRPSFPHRGRLVEMLHYILVFSNALVLWLVIFWVGYETRACARFIETLSGVSNQWPERLLVRKEKETGLPREYLDDYLDFQLIVRVTQRIHWLIYLPFVSILFMVLSRSDLFDAMDFPLALVFVTGLALAYALNNAWLLRKSAESARAKAIEHYETWLLTQARAKDSHAPATADGAAAGLTRPPIGVDQIKILMERIRSTREGAFAPFAQQPALQALLLPFGGYGGAQLIEYLINFKM